MPSTLYLGTDETALADRLGEVLEAEVQAGDFFQPLTVVVSNRYVAKWLRLFLARRLGIAINLNIDYLFERSLWQVLERLDSRQHPAPLHRLTEEEYRWMILAALLEPGSPASGVASSTRELPEPAQPRSPAAQGDLAPLCGYLAASGGPRRSYWRRAWQLAGQLAGLIRDYEYHRQDEIIQKWIAGELAFPDASEDEVRLERSQRALFRRIIAEPDGLRARLGRSLGALCKTLPQYACELMLDLEPEQLRKIDQPKTLHLFGLTQISSFHLRVLKWLAGHLDIRLYHLNPLVGQLTTLPPESQQAHARLVELSERFRADGVPIDEEAGAAMLRAWGRAAAESLGLMARLLEPPSLTLRAPTPSFECELVPAPVKQPASVLGRIHAALSQSTMARERLPQDLSVQIAACPGIYREVETIHHSIVHNLQSDPKLKQTDIAVLVTDMSRYRPVIQAVFDRPPQPVLYNLADYSAAELSPYGRAVVGLLDLALEAFTRSNVFALLLNPCFLARLGADREQALVWMRWADALGICHCWDREEKKQRGYPESPTFSWRLGLQRLRLGRLMEVPREEDDAPAMHYAGVLPYADLESGDREQLDAFSRAVEGLLPRLMRLRHLRANGATWAEELRRLFDDVLAPPRDRPDEAHVRNSLLRTLDSLKLFDGLHGEARHGSLPLALVREFVLEHLETLKATVGEYLTGGVTVSALQPILPVPFKIIYLLGLGETLFPGSSRPARLDLRSRGRLLGDIRPAETNRLLFLETLLSAKEKLYLLYDCRDLEKDQVLHPASTVMQLKRILEAHALRDQKLEIIPLPLQGHDPKFLDGKKELPTDLVVNYSVLERKLALDQLRRGAELDAATKSKIDPLLADIKPSFALTAAPQAAPQRAITVSVRELARFLRCPADAAVRRHLRLPDDDQPEMMDDEPFFTGFPHNYRLTTTSLRRFVRRAVRGGVRDALKNWREMLRDLHNEWRLRARVPEEAFADVDHRRFEELLAPRIEGQQGLAGLLKELAKAAFCGPVLIGESFTPLNALVRFPGLGLRPGVKDLFDATGMEVRIVGSQDLVWKTKETVEILCLTNYKEDKVPRDQLSCALLEPLLFALALRAGRDAHPNQPCSRDWLGDRTVRMHIAHTDGRIDFVYLAETISSNQARDYLTMLLEDFLERDGFDPLPFDLIVRESELQAAYLPASDDVFRKTFIETPKFNETRVTKLAMALALGRSNGGLSKPEQAELQRLRQWYRDQFVACLDEDQETMHPAYRPSEVVSMVGPEVPADAFDKVRRRFWLLDRIPAAVRGAPAEEED